MNKMKIMNEVKYETTRYFSDYGESDGFELAYNLTTMMSEMKAKIYLEIKPTRMDKSKLKWIMTLDTFNWITNICDRAYGFYYQVEFSCTKPNRYTIMDVDVMFVDDEYMNQCRIVKLSYVEPIDIKWNADNIVTNTTWDCISNSLRGVDLRNWNLGTGTIETRKEKFMKSFYVGTVKKVYIENVIFNKPATIVFWSDGTKTVVKRQKGDKKFDPEKGLAMAICKKVMGNKGNFNDIFKEWIEEE